MIDNTTSARTNEERKRLILVVEDMVDARELYADYLAYAGFSAHSYANAVNGWYERVSRSQNASQ